MGGHKGYCFSFFIEVMCAVLTGGCILHVGPWMDLPTKTQTSHSVIIVNTAVMMDLKIFEERMASIIKEIAESPKAEGSDRIYLPGEIEWERYEKAEKSGLELPDDILKNARSLARMTGLDFENCIIP